MVLVRPRRVVGALLALVLAAGLTTVLPTPSASAAPVQEPVTASLVVTGTSRVDETIVLSVSLSSSTATGVVDLQATDGKGRTFGWERSSRVARRPGR